ncbi:hypothetical protein FHR83_002930 [Actinoplanes campanulatus]|uniref:Uncharacterized protein n=1 Tax=Actinoplanes campanulatus TaxID=113559 RepID=A0A7W5AF99_9ACTN|nr:hypothetical protein [Actinoplanes campanulatus]MBB3095267.1 hypothetical protein [Actinoplanes campanulatus]GGN41230.1 hypothetical protein GCM10010109_71110 [Actinoplanes campanulatus]GID34871.1 hypothetical protein Aca09nite_13770 [Actinoplanes campanulatus]
MAQSPRIGSVSWGAMTVEGLPPGKAETGEAVRLYNELAGSQPVGGLFHSTC